ncbi:ABC transporter permease [Pseudarthrobacter sulfonivorans]|uniref:ABC transporter permease n=1 Tax=Pseudarthrobacter sulfonivorans TaxID=121292 RepID=UPI00168B9037|nr:ABC transporter permease [Pseudarthrobacter sulfonivorans]
MGRTTKRFLADRVGLASLALLIAIVLFGVLSLIWTPYDTAAQDLLARMQGPSTAHWLGTDNLGRDIFSRLMCATWTAVASCVLALTISLIGGVGLGLIAGYLEGPLDGLLSRLTDVLMSLPPILFAVGIVGALGPSLQNAMIAIGILLLPRFFRLTRITTVEVKNETFVEAARSSGAGPLRIVWFHILPNIVAPLVIQVSLAASVAIVAEASLSFIGLGIQPPDPSWGSMAKEGFDRLAQNGWIIIPPSTILILAILMLSLLGDSLRDATGR